MMLEAYALRCSIANPHLNNELGMLNELQAILGCSMNAVMQAIDI